MAGLYVMECIDARWIAGQVKGSSLHQKGGCEG